jgi:hypothetical protein
MPQDLLEKVFDHLDPKSLASAACVCQAWNQDALDEARWKLFWEAAQADSQNASIVRGATVRGTYRERVAQLATGLPTFPWRRASLEAHVDT